MARCVQAGNALNNKMYSNYCIKDISNSLALQMVVTHHHLHTKCPCSEAFGLFEIATDKCVGVVTYGVPHSPTLRRGICGKDEEHNVYELNRVWVDPSVPAGGEAYLIANTIRKVKRQIIVSYVDTSYRDGVAPLQVAGFYYTGVTGKHTSPVVKGRTGHHASLAHGLPKSEFIDFYGEDNVTYVQRSRKHRFVFFNAKTRRLKALRDKLRYPIIPASVVY